MADELVAGRYRLETRLGGGMSEVWLAEDAELDRHVALKFLGRGADPARFDREARAVAALAHPNICRLYDYGDAAGRPFMVLEFLPGGTLEDRLAPGRPHPDDETERIARDLASGLAYAHDQGLVHRDLKPANILFDEEGRAKIADFGIARVGGSRTLTETGTLLGTAAYISPEQAQGQPATPASDVYSFGVILYRLLTGRLPFEAESPVELARMHVQVQPQRVREVRAGAPLALAAVADAALAKDPADRPPDGAALAEALGSGATALEAPTVVAAGRPAPGRRLGPVPLPLAVVALVLAAIAVAGALVAVLIGGSSDAQPAPTQQTHTGGAGTTTPAVAPPTHAENTTGRTKTEATTAAPPPPPAPPATPQPPPPAPPPTPSVPTTVPTTLPTTVTLPVTTPPPPPPPAP